MTHASRTLQSHDLSGERIKLWITYILFDHTRTWKASPVEWSAQCRGHLQDSTNMKDNTHQAHTQASQQGKYGMMIMMVKWYPETLGGLQIPDICLTGEEKPPKKPHPGNLSRPGIEPGPAAWQACMLLLAPQRWTLQKYSLKCYCVLWSAGAWKWIGFYFPLPMSSKVSLTWMSSRGCEDSCTSHPQLPCSISLISNGCFISMWTLFSVPSQCKKFHTMSQWWPVIWNLWGRIF